MDKAIIFSAPSGAGKTTLVKRLLEMMPNLQFSISACNRQKRDGETHARDYYFLTTDDFKQRIEQNDFIEWEEVYADNYYGTLKSEIQRIWDAGKIAIFDVDVKGGLNIKNYFGSQALAIFVMPPDIETLKNRLQNRNTEKQQDIERRIARASEELTYASKFDVIIINDDLNIAVNETFNMVAKFLNNEF